MLNLLLMPGFEEEVIRVACKDSDQMMYHLLSTLVALFDSKNAPHYSGCLVTGCMHVTLDVPKRTGTHKDNAMRWLLVCCRQPHTGVQNADSTRPRI